MKQAGNVIKKTLPAFFMLLLLFFTVWISFPGNLGSELAFLALNNASTSTADTRLLGFSGQTMGTQYRILLHASSFQNPAARQELEDNIVERLHFLDKTLFSTYEPDSQLSQLNFSAAGERVGVSGEIITVIRKAQDVYRESSGAFDVTIKPLVDLWGFGTTESHQQVPGQIAIDSALNALDMNALEFIQDGERHYVKKSKAVFIDLSGIAKGYAVDQIGMMLDATGLEDYLVEIGGEVVSRGRRPDGQNWRIGIERPDSRQPMLFQQILNEEEKLAAATSGNYKNFFTYEGRQYSHTINPLTGWPVPADLVSVTVVGSSAMEADAWATALIVLGFREGIKRANDLQLAAFFIVNGSAGYQAHPSEAFLSYL